MMTSSTFISGHLGPKPDHQSSAECPPCHPVVLDLCIRRRPVSPDYTLSYPSPKRSPPHEETQTPMYYTNPMLEGSETSECSNLSDVTINVTTSPSSRHKTARPFKAFPRIPLPLNLDVLSKTDRLLGTDSTTAYEEFRQRMLARMRPDNSGTNKNMRRNQGHSEKPTDPSYLEKRKKNNEAAKRSRDARRAKEDEIAIRCAFLEQENMNLKMRIATLEREIERAQRVIYY